MLTKQWDKKVLSAFVGQYVENSAYYNAIGISSSDLKQFIVDMLLNKQQIDAHCIVASSSDNLSAVGYLHQDRMLFSREHPIYYSHCFLLPEADEMAIKDLVCTIDGVLSGEQNVVLRLKCNSTADQHKQLEYQGLQCYYTSIKLVYNGNVSASAHCEPGEDLVINMSSEIDSDLLDMLLMHRSSERYMHPFLQREILNQYYNCWWLQRLQTSECITFRVESQNRLVALAVLSKPRQFVDLTQRPIYTLDFLYVLPEFRRQGIGEALICRILNDYGTATIETCCSKDNSVIVDILKRNGFSQIELNSFYAKHYNSPIAARP